MGSLEGTYRPLLEAVSFAARAHRHQVRKDGQTPYVSHVFRVCLIVRHVFGIDDPAALMAGVLHDTVEDTNTDYDDLQEQLGDAAGEVPNWVGLLSKDKRLPEKLRERKYRAGLHAACWQVKVCKLADIFDNLLDSKHTKPEQRQRTFRHSRIYLQALGTPDLPKQARRAWDIVDQLLHELESQPKGSAGG
jgi:(p)ppGpp synthase/HD superfamily hydrolase